MPNSFPWYAYICGPYYNPKNFVLDLGQIKVVGSGNDHGTSKDDLRAIAQQLDVKSTPVYVHVVFQGPPLDNSGAHPLTIYRMKKEKGKYLVHRRDGGLWVTY